LWQFFIKTKKAECEPILVYANKWSTNNKLLKELILYPLVVLICWLPDTIYRLTETVYGEVLILRLLQSIFPPIVGFGNSIVYFLTTSTFRTMYYDLKCLYYLAVGKESTTIQKETSYLHQSEHPIFFNERMVTINKFW